MSRFYLASLSALSPAISVVRSVLKVKSARDVWGARWSSGAAIWCILSRLDCSSQGKCGPICTVAPLLWCNGLDWVISSSKLNARDHHFWFRPKGLTFSKEFSACATRPRRLNLAGHLALIIAQRNKILTVWVSVYDSRDRVSWCKAGRPTTMVSSVGLYTDSGNTFSGRMKLSPPDLR
jgi:hypothetical protein